MDFQGAAGKEEAALQSRQEYLASLALQRDCATPGQPTVAAAPAAPAPIIAAVPAVPVAPDEPVAPITAAPPQQPMPMTPCGEDRPCSVQDTIVFKH